MSLTDLDALREGTQLVKRGEFTLDEQRAREKMAKFQRADPRAYVLSLVAAAHACGARSVLFDPGAHETRVCFDGRSYDAEDFEQLFGAQFTSAHSDRLDARKELALAVHSACALEPRHVTVRSGRCRYTLTPSREPSLETDLSLHKGTEVRVDEPLRMASLGRWYRSWTDQLAEGDHLRRGALHSELSVFVGDERISADFKLGPWGQHYVQADARAAFDLTPKDEAQLHLYRRGVLISATQSPWPRVSAHVDSLVFTKDASQSGVVQDQAAMQLLSELQREAWIYLDRHAEQLGPVLSVTTLRQWLQSSGLPANAGLTWVHSVPLFQDARNPEERVNLGQVRQARQQDGVVHVCDASHRPDPHEPLTIRYASDGESALLHKLFVPNLKDVTVRLRQRVKRRENSKLWLPAPPGPPTLDDGVAWLCRLPFERGVVRGEVGLTAEPASGYIEVRHKDRVLRRGCDALPGIGLTLDGALTMRSDRGWVGSSSKLAACCHAAFDAMLRLTEELAGYALKQPGWDDSPKWHHLRQHTLCVVLDLAIAQDGRVRFAQSVGLYRQNATKARQVLQAADAQAASPAWTLEHAGASALGQLPLVEVGTGWQSLRQVLDSPLPPRGLPPTLQKHQQRLRQPKLSAMQREALSRLRATNGQETPKKPPAPPSVEKVPGDAPNDGTLEGVGELLGAWSGKRRLRRGKAKRGRPAWADRDALTFDESLWEQWSDLASDDRELLLATLALTAVNDADQASGPVHADRLARLLGKRLPLGRKG